MEKVRSFEDLVAWQKGHQLIIEVFNCLNSPTSKIDNVINCQMKRAAISICSNIAEGYDRNSDKQLLYFLKIAKGSCAELRAQLLMVKDLMMIPSTTAMTLYGMALEVSKIIGGLIKYINKSITN